MKHIGIIFGTRPEAVKLAPVIKALESDGRFRIRLVSTGQHREMLDHTLAEFGICPEVNLAVMRPGQSLTGTTRRILDGVERTGCLDDLDGLMVHGDTATTLAGALAGVHRQVPVIHVEAGLRSGTNSSPFPEEVNRKLVAQISSLHLAATPGNAANLIREGISEADVVVTGNTVVDALRWGTAQEVRMNWPGLEDLDADPRRVVLASAHRRESHGKPLVEIAHGLRALALARPDIRIVVPLHLNPNVRAVLEPVIAGVENISVVEPLPYLQFCQLLLRTDIVLSDSSGAEEEGPALGIPTLVLRELSERKESLLTGSSKLVGRRRDLISAAVEELLDDRVLHASMSTAINPYGDGRAAPRVIEAMAHHFQLGPACQPFVAGAARDRDYAA